MHYDVIIIGGGIIGCATAFQLLQRDTTLRVALLEKEPSLGLHQTGHNSGVIHAGVYYPPDSLKAKFCIAGCQATKAFCTEHRIPFEVPGKIIAATDEEEVTRMQALMLRSFQNGVDVEKIDIAEAQRLQPGLSTVGALFVKDTGIVDWKQVCEKYAELFQRAGGQVFYQARVVAIKESMREVVVRTPTQVYTSDYLITCAGLQADRVIKMSGLRANFKMIPFRGEYFKLNKKYNHNIRHLIYPVPRPHVPFLGVHFTPHIDHYVTVGPNAVLALAREGYRWQHINIKDCFETIIQGAFWKLVLSKFDMVCDQFCDSIFKSRYLKTIQKYFPMIQAQDLENYPAGVRAQAIDSDGKLIDDFLFMETDRCLHTCNAPSPAATASLPIGGHIVDRFMGKLNLF